jgi:hypothetical protein
MEEHLNETSVKAGSAATGKVYSYSTLPWDSPVHVFEEKEHSMTLQDEGEESKLERSQEHCLLRSHEDQPEYLFSRDLPVDLPSLSFDSDEVPVLSKMYTIQAILSRTPILSLPKTVQVVASKHQEVDSSLTLEVEDTVPLVKSYFCCLWETTMDTYNLVPSCSSISVHPGQALSVQVNDPKSILPTGYFLQVKLTQCISLFAKGKEAKTEDSRILSRNRDGNVPIHTSVSLSHIGRWIQVQHEMVLSLKYKQQVVASSPKIRVRVVRELHTFG